MKFLDFLKSFTKKKTPPSIDDWVRDHVAKPRPDEAVIVERGADDVVSDEAVIVEKSEAVSQTVEDTVVAADTESAVVSNVIEEATIVAKEAESEASIVAEKASVEEEFVEDVVVLEEDDDDILVEEETSPEAIVETPIESADPVEEKHTLPVGDTISEIQPEDTHITSEDVTATPDEPVSVETIADEGADSIETEATIIEKEESPSTLESTPGNITDFIGDEAVIVDKKEETVQEEAPIAVGDTTNAGDATIKEEDKKEEGTPVAGEGGMSGRPFIGSKDFSEYEAVIVDPNATDEGVEADIEHEDRTPLGGQSLPEDIPLTSKNPFMLDKWKKISTFAAIPFIVMLFLLYLMPLFVDLDEYQETVIAHVKASTGRDVSISGGVELDIFPLPRVIVSGVKVKNQVNEKALLTTPFVEVRPSLFFLMLGKVHVSELVMHNPVMLFEHFVGESPSWKQASTASSATKNTETAIEKVILKDATFTFRSGQKQRPVERVLHMTESTIKMDSLLGPFDITGTVMPSDKAASLDFTSQIGDLTGESALFSLKLTAGDASLMANGKIVDWLTQPVVKGGIAARMDRSVKSLGHSFGISERFIPIIFTKDRSEFQGKFLLSKEGMEINSIIFNGQNTKAKGGLTVAFGAINTVHMNLEFEELDLDSIIDKEFVSGAVKSSDQNAIPSKKRQQEEAEQAKRAGAYDDIAVELDMTIDRARLNQHELRAIAMKASLGGGHTVIHSLKAQGLPGESQIEWSGKLSRIVDAQLLQQFEGSVVVTGKDMKPFLSWISGKPVTMFKEEALRDYKIDGDIVISEEQITFSRILLLVDKSSLLGQARIKTGKTPVINSAFRMNRLDLDEYIADGVSLGKKDPSDLNASMAQFDLLRNIDRFFEKIAISLQVDELVYEEQLHRNFSSTFFIKAGILEIKKLQFQNDDLGAVKAKMVINTESLNPNINLDLFISSLNTKDLGRLTGGRLDFSSADSVSASTKPTWSAVPFDFSMLHPFEGGRIKLSIQRFRHGKLRMDGVNGAFDIANNKVNIRSFRTRVFDSELDLKGSIGIAQRPFINATMSFSNADMYEMLSSLFGIDVMTGRVSLSASLSASGYSMEQWISSLEGSGSIAARGLVINGFDLPVLSKQVPAVGAIKDVRYWTHAALSSGKTDINYVSGNAKVSQGVVSMYNVALSHPLFSQALMNMSISLPQWLMNMKTQWSLKSTTEVRKGDVPVKVSVSGDISDPSVEWDKQAIERYWERSFYGEQ